MYHINHMLRTHQEYAELEDSAWQDADLLKKLSIAASTDVKVHETERLGPSDEDHLFDAHTTVWKILQVVSTDPKYLWPTEYNLFTLLRIGNQELVKHPVRSLPSSLL
jgi:hypothetical protein